MFWPILLGLLPLLANGAPTNGKLSFNPKWYEAGLYGAYIEQNYKSFDLAPPAVNFIQRDPRCDQSYTFLEPRGMSVPSPGPLILDAHGELVWMEDSYGQAMDFRVQRYRGDDYLTFWIGTDSGTHGFGSYVMLNSSYDIVYEVTPSGNLDGDLHEFQITTNDTALMTIYDIIPADLSSIGGPKDGWIYDGIFQELDIASGELLFEWRASDHYAVEETLAPVGKKGRSEGDAFDYFHINSVDKDDKGNYYISSRYMHTITCIARSGDILWKLGGRHNDFKDLSEGAATNFAWQHHARWYPNNIITVFDNAAYDSYDSLATTEHSRGLKISLDTDRMMATLLQDYVSPGIRAHSQGSVQILPSNNVFVGWGHTSAFTEFAPNGEILCEAHFGASALFGWGWVKSYRGFKGNWTGQPSTPPDIELRPGYLRTTAYVSWNGATEVKYWRLESTSRVTADEHDFEPIETIPKTGFESSFSVPKKTGEYLRIVALDKDYKPLGHTDLIYKKTGQLAENIHADVEDSDLISLQSLMVFCGFITLLFGARTLYRLLRNVRRV